MMYRSTEHIFHVSLLENSYIFDIMTQKSANAPELWRDTTMPPFMELFVKLLFPAYHKLIIVINLV